MPHKHTRRVKEDSTYDLPPTQQAKPLPAYAAKPAKQNGNPRHKNATKPADESAKSLKRKRNDGGANKKDDAPRAFRRIMAYAQGRRVKDGLDDGTIDRKAKKARTAAASDKSSSQSTAPSSTRPATAKPAKPPPPPPPAPAVAIPKIKPGERLSEYSARVDAALPVAGLISKTIKNGKDPLGLKVTRTKKEKKMHKLYDQWRAEEAAIRERKREEMEDAEERDMDEDGGLAPRWSGIAQQGGDDDDENASGVASGKKKKSGKNGKKGSGGGAGTAKSVYESAEADDGRDPWDEIKRKRGEVRARLNDTVKAPPEFKHLPKKVLYVRGAAVEVGSVPKAAGSLRRREELEGVRNEVVASYRKMMASRRPDLLAGAAVVS